MTTTTQIKINGLGIAHVRPGMHIKEVGNAIPFHMFLDKHLFEVFPSEKNLYFLEVDPKRYQEQLHVRYTFACADEEGLVKRITFFIDDKENNIQLVLDSLFGHIDTKGKFTVNEADARKSYSYWTTTQKTSIHLIRSMDRCSAENPPSTIVHIYFANSFESFSDMSIEFRM